MVEGKFTFERGTVSGPNASLPQIDTIDVKVCDDNNITMAKISNSNIPPSTEYSSETKKYMFDQRGHQKYLIKEKPGMSSNVLTTDSEGFQVFLDGLITPEDIKAFKEHIERNIKFKPVEKCSKDCGSEFDVKFGTELQRPVKNTSKDFEDSVGPDRVAEVINNGIPDLLLAEQQKTDTEKTGPNE